MINGNRQLNEAKIKRIMRDIDDGLDVLRYCPILVKENGDTLDIVDGQHRFYVSRKMKCAVWYIISEDMSLHDIAKINSNTEKWKARDFINCYTQLGNKHYITLDKFVNDFGFNPGVAIMMLQSGFIMQDGGGQNEKAKPKFESGQFEVKELEKATLLAQKCLLFNKFSSYLSRSFVKAVGTIMQNNKVQIDDIAEKFNDNPTELVSKNNHKDYLAQLELIYNKGKHNRITIF